ncbi:MAG: C2 family cysteine protease [Vulcanimicrobiota bacterium]
MKISQGGSGAQPLRGTGYAQKLKEASLEFNQALSPAEIAGLQGFYGRTLEAVDQLRGPAPGSKLRQILPQGYPEVVEATAPNVNDNGDARQVRGQYRSLLRELRREATRALNSGESSRTGPDGVTRAVEWREGSLAVERGDTRLELLGETVRRTQTHNQAVQVDQFHLDEQGRPVRDLLLTYDGSAPQRLIAQPDGSALWQRLGEEQQLLPASGQAKDGRLPCPWWRERDPGEEWEVPASPPVVQEPGAPEPGLGGLSPSQTNLVAAHFSLLGGGDLRAEVSRRPALGVALEKFGQAARAEAQPKPAPISPQEVHQSTKELVGILERLFDKLDANHDGKIDMDELKKASHDPALNKKDAVAVATLFALVGGSEQFKKGFTKEHLAGLKSGAAGAESNSAAAYWFQKFEIDQSYQSHQVFPGDIIPETVRQGRFGTCYFLAALVSKAMADPNSVKQMIKDNKNGTYTVTFPGAKAVTVSAPTEVELLVHASAGANGMWATIIEKAFGQLKNDDSWFPKKEAMDKAEGGWEADGIGPLSKKGVDTDELWITFNSTTREKIKKALKNHKMIVCCVEKGGSKEIQDQHAYTVVGYDEKTDRVKIRNPWGKGGNRAEPQNPDGSPKDGQMDGVFELTIDQFCKIFTSIGYEE